MLTWRWIKRFCISKPFIHLNKCTSVRSNQQRHQKNFTMCGRQVYVLTPILFVISLSFAFAISRWIPIFFASEKLISCKWTCLWCRTRINMLPNSTRRVFFSNFFKMKISKVVLDNRNNKKFRWNCAVFFPSWIYSYPPHILWVRYTITDRVFPSSLHWIIHCTWIPKTFAFPKDACIKSEPCLP